MSTGCSLLNLSGFFSLVSGFWAWISEQSCFPEVKKVREPCLKHRISFIFRLCYWCAVSSKFLLSKSFWAVHDVLLRSISPKLRFPFFIRRIEPIFPKTLRRVYDPVFSNIAQAFVEKTLLCFFWGLGSISESCFYSELRKADVCAEVEHQPIQWPAVVIWFCQNVFQPVSVEKKAFVFIFVQANSTLTTARYVSHFWRSFSTKAVVGSNGFLRSCLGKVLFESCAHFWWLKIFGSELLAKLNENQVSSEGECHFVAILWRVILYLASHYHLADVKCIVSSIPYLADIFWFFTKFCPKKIVQRTIFQLTSCKTSNLRDSPCFMVIHITWTEKQI